MPTDKENHMDHSDCLPTINGGCQHGHDDCPRQAQYLEDKKALRGLLDKYTDDTTLSHKVTEERHPDHLHRVAVTVFMEVEGEWIDPENVAVEIVKYLVTKNPRGMSRPHPVSAPRSIDSRSDEILRATVHSVQDAQEALHSFTVTPNRRPYR